MRQIIHGTTHYLAIWLLFGGLNASAQSFPTNWEGMWGGEMIISSSNQEVQRVIMSLDIRPLTDSTWTWTIQYGEEAAGRRPYQLLVKDATTGHYAIDEGNDIILDAFYHDGTLYSRFSVMESLLTSRVQLWGDSLVYEIISGPLAPIAETGGTSEEIPPVQSYGIPVRQRAILVRQ